MAKSDNNLTAVFTDIANAIRNKTGNTATMTPRDFADGIMAIETSSEGGTGIDTSDATATSNDMLLDKTAYANGEKIVGTIPTYNNEHENGYVQIINTLKKLLDTTKSASYLFYYYKGTSVDDLINYSDTENVTNMSRMFYYCQNLQTIPLLDTSKVTNMLNMFYYCQNLQSIPQLNTSNVTNMDNMFYSCSKLQTIDLTHMNIKATLYSSNMCNDCNSLTKFIIRNMDTIPALDSHAFDSCYHFTGTRNSTYNPNGLKDGRIYVPDGKVDELKQAANWSVYADIIVPLSTLIE